MLLIWTGGYFAHISSRTILKNLFIENAESLAEQKIDKVHNFLQHRIEIFQEFASQRQFQQEIALSNEQFSQNAEIQSFITERDHQWLQPGDKEQLPFINDILQSWISDELRGKALYHEKKNGFRVFGEVFVTNKYGAVIAATQKITDYRQDDEYWWSVAKREGIYIGDIAYDESAAMYGMDIGIRFDDEKGGFAGIIKLVLNVKDIINIIKTFTHHDMHASHGSMETTLVTREGKLIYSTTGMGVLFDDVTGDFERGELEILLSDMPLHIESRGRLVVHAHANGHGSKSFEDLGWTLMISHRTSEIYRGITDLRNKILMVSAGVTFFALLLGYSMAVLFLRAIRSIRDAVIKTAEGDLDAHISVYADDELGQLATAFNDMQTKLKKTTVSRDELVREMSVRKSAEDGLLEGEARLRSIIDTASDAIISIDSRGRMIFINSAAELMFGYSTSEMAGHSAKKLMPERFREYHEKGMERY